MPAYEVRCCCNPGKLLGYIEMPEPRGVHVRFPLRGGNNIDLELCEFSLDGLRFKTALKSNDYPLEKLKQITGFIQAETK